MNTSSSQSESVKELRTLTGLGLLECKKLLAQCDGDIARVLELLRKGSEGPEEPEPEPVE